MYPYSPFVAPSAPRRIPKTSPVFRDRSPGPLGGGHPGADPAPGGSAETTDLATNGSR